MGPPQSLGHLVGALALISTISASVIPATNPFKVSMRQFTKLGERDGEAWPYGVVGHSWGSGVAWSNDTLYDNNQDDTGWKGHHKTTLHDAACSGRTLGDIVQGEHQMGQVGNPNVVVMTAGGNNAGFGHIVDVCIYHSDPNHNYGPAYKDDTNRTGDCAVALDGALAYITKPLSEGAPGMEYDLRATLNDVFKDPSVKGNSDFLLYVTGYAQFFGTDYDAWCNNQYWSIPSNPIYAGPTPYLSVELRQTINDHVGKVNSIYQNVSSSYSNQTRYVDLDKRFAGHRFCEPGATYQDQINTDTHFDGVWLWNLNYPWQITGQGAPSTQAAAGNVRAQEASSLFQGQGVTAWSGLGTGGNDPSNGWRLRPFHPRYTGYTSIKDAIFEQLNADGLPDLQTASDAQPAAPAAPSPTSTQPTPPTCSHVGNQNTQCHCSDNSSPPIDEDDRCCVTDPASKQYLCYNADGSLSN